MEKECLCTRLPKHTHHAHPLLGPDVRTRKIVHDNYNDIRKKDDHKKCNMNDHVVGSVFKEKCRALVVDGVNLGTTHRLVFAGVQLENISIVSRAIEFEGTSVNGYTGDLSSFLATTTSKFDLVVLDLCSSFNHDIETCLELLFNKHLVAKAAVVMLTLSMRSGNKMTTFYESHDKARTFFHGVAQKHSYYSRDALPQPLVNGNVFSIFFKLCKTIPAATLDDRRVKHLNHRQWCGEYVLPNSNNVRPMYHALIDANMLGLARFVEMQPKKKKRKTSITLELLNQDRRNVCSDLSTDDFFRVSDLLDLSDALFRRYYPDEDRLEKILKIFGEK